MTYDNVIMEWAGFEWDEGNLLKNWEKHGVSAGECEQFFFNRPLIARHDEQVVVQSARAYIEHPVVVIRLEVGGGKYHGIRSPYRIIPEDLGEPYVVTDRDPDSETLDLHEKGPASPGYAAGLSVVKRVEEMHLPVRTPYRPVPSVDHGRVVHPVAAPFENGSSDYVDGTGAGEV